MEYTVATSDDELYFYSTNLRADLSKDKEAMRLTALQQAFSVLACKQRMEKIRGVLSNLDSISHHQPPFFAFTDRRRLRKQ